MFTSIIVAAILGAAMGMQRDVAGKPAGYRTYALVSLGACVFTIISHAGFTSFAASSLDPSRVAAQVVVGIGFLGAGLIFVRGGHVEGLTTAAGLWVAAAIGMSAGVREYSVAVITTIIAFALLSIGPRFQPNEWWERWHRSP